MQGVIREVAKLRTARESIRDELLVLRCQRQDRAALQELIQAWEKPLFYYVRRIVDSEADAWDVLQKTWMEVLRRISSLREARSLPVWLYTIARRTALKHFRIENYSRRFQIEQEELADLQAPEDKPSFQDAEQVSYGLGRVSPVHREVLTLFFLEDLSVDDIAVVLDLPAGTVKSRLFYARRALRQVLDEKEGSHE